MHINRVSELLQSDTTDQKFLKDIASLDISLLNYFSQVFFIDKNLTRQLVSFQANKTSRYYRWYKYKEAFSADLIQYLLKKYDIKKGKVLDPFAGSGTALFACSDFGYDTDGIELLPIGQKIISANILVRSPQKKDIISRLNYWLLESPWNKEGKSKNFGVLRITDGAYPKDTSYKIQRYLHEINYEQNDVQEMLMFALLCILESISYTRKDGQCLRWDYRTKNRNIKSHFNKGRVLSFDEAISSKLKDILNDITGKNRNLNLFSLIEKKTLQGKISILKGSCLSLLSNMKNRSYTGIITSPPYCNRYDYTRTYALEHALLGVSEDELSLLRQSMLSCTVENKKKDLTSFNKEWTRAIKHCEETALLQKILSYLDYKKEKKELNNNGIARMVRGYFYEMSCVIQECYRVLKKNGYMFMVNDNVRYAGVSISIDMILSKIAESLGFRVENILVLEQKKGNSSQQMGKHGRETLRKCIYVWKKGD